MSEKRFKNGKTRTDTTTAEELKKPMSDDLDNLVKEFLAYAADTLLLNEDGHDDLVSLGTCAQALLKRVYAEQISEEHDYKRSAAFLKAMRENTEWPNV